MNEYEYDVYRVLVKRLILICNFTHYCAWNVNKYDDMNMIIWDDYGSVYMRNVTRFLFHDYVYEVILSHDIGFDEIKFSSYNLLIVYMLYAGKAPKTYVMN